MLTIKNLTKTIDFSRAEELLHFALDGRLANDVQLNIVESDKTLDRLGDAEYELQALLYRPVPDPHQYSLIIRKRLYGTMESIIFHEAIHLSQFEDGRLDIDMKAGTYTWSGEEWPADYPYLSRPWEIEAFRGQAALSKEWRDLQKSVKKVKKCLFKKSK